MLAPATKPAITEPKPEETADKTEAGETKPEEIAEEAAPEEKAEEKTAEEVEAEKLAAKAEAERAEAEKEAARLEAEEKAKKLIEEEEKRKRAVKEAKIYDFEIEHIKTEDCLRCHISQYSRIVDNGGKHLKVVCTACHRVFHAYNPRKANYEEIMPKCVWCHDDPHGKERVVLRCLNCHTDPHQPVESVPDPATLEQNCKICHEDIGALLEENPTKHTQQECSSCHSKKHGRIPDCSECHESHSPKMELKTPDCLSCHPVHTPLKISYPVTQSKELCVGCHDKPYKDLDERITKHSALTCAKCHPQHGKLMACQDCHGKFVHDPRIHQQFKSCGECHNIAHKLDK